MANIQELFKKHFEGSINVNKAIIKQYGTDAAVLLGELISKQKYWEENGRLDNGRFYWSIRDVQETTGLKRWSINKAVAKLRGAGLIKVKSIPCKITLYSVNVDTVINCLNTTVLKTTQDCAKNNTATVSETTHTNPITNPNKKSTAATDNLDIKETDPNLKAVVSLYYELLEKHTGDTPIRQWAKDSSIMKKAADGQIMAQGADKVKDKLRAWFQSADGFTRNNGFPLGLFVKQYNNIKGGSNYPEYERLDDLPKCVGECHKCAAIIWENDARCRSCSEPVRTRRYIDS